MTRAFTLPDIGEGIHEAEIQEVLVAQGEEVEADQTILRVETDKAAVDIPSPFSGTVEEIMVQTGDIVEVGDPLISFSGEEKEAETNAEPAEEADQEPQEESEAKEKTRAAKPDQTEEKEGEPSEKRASQESDRPVPASPATRRLARELEVDLHQVPASGPAGRVTSEDVRAFAEGETETKEEAPAPAREEKRAEQEAAERPSPWQPVSLPDFNRWGETERVPLRSVRRATARKMTQAWSQIPHAVHHDRADITGLDRLRRKEKDDIEDGSLTLTVFILKAVAAALEQYPRFNASLDTEAQEIILKQYCHVGMAVDTDRGLLVPVIRDVNHKSMADLAVEWPELVKRTQAGELSPEDMQGGTFTITNVGILGGTHFTPIINHPQVAILGMAQADWQPVVRTRNEEKFIEPRYLLPLVIAFDHRVVDGADAARFMGTLKESLEDPDKLMLKA